VQGNCGKDEDKNERAFELAQPGATRLLAAVANMFSPYCF
jgi:hypothetical protein